MSKHLESINVLWTDKKRILGMPISFTRYSLSEDRLFVERGFLSKRYDETPLYKISDISVKRSFGQSILGVGSVYLIAADPTNPDLELKNIRRPLQVKELIHLHMEQCKQKRNVRYNEFSGGMMPPPGPVTIVDKDGDGLPD